MRSKSLKGVNKYAAVQRQTAGPGQRVVLMYDGIIRELRQAAEKVGSDDPGVQSELNDHIQLAQRLILELKLALDHDRGGEIAENLGGLYDFWNDHLSTANIENRRQPLDDVLGMVRDLREAWSDAVKEARTLGVG